MTRKRFSSATAVHLYGNPVRPGDLSVGLTPKLPDGSTELVFAMNAFAMSIGRLDFSVALSEDEAKQIRDLLLHIYPQ